MNSQTSSEPRPKITLKTVLITVAFAALLVAIATIQYRNGQMVRRQQGEMNQLQIANEALQQQLDNTKGQGLRTAYAEKILFHVISSPEKYPNLTKDLANRKQRKYGIGLHPLDQDDNLACVTFYSQDNKDLVPYCYSFLITEEPFAVLDYVAGEQSRTARMHEDHWTIGAGQKGQDRWFQIIDKKFAPYRQTSP